MGMKLVRTVADQEADIARNEKRLQTAILAYVAVWDSWRGLDAHSVEQCRRAAMSAALAACNS